MNEYIRTHRKKFLAVFGVLLMISFVAFTGTPGGPNTANATVGTIHGGKVKVGYRDVTNYSRQWQFLKGQYGPVRLVAMLGGASADEEMAARVMTDPEVFNRLRELIELRQRSPQFYQMIVNSQPGLQMMASMIDLGGEIFSHIEANDDLYALLATEADALGVGVNPDLLNTLLTNSGVTREADEALYDSLRQSLRTFLMVANAGNRAARVAKVSLPERERFLATRGQRVSLNVVEFNAKDYLDKVPAPTDARLKEQFDKFKDVVSTAPGVAGYKYPNRVKYEAIEIKKDAVKKAVPPVETDEAYEFYLANRGSGKFETSTPATTQPDPFTLDRGPTTRVMKFEEAREQIVIELTDKRVAELTDRIREFALQTMKDDYAAYRAAAPAGGTTAPSNPPVTSLGVPYNSKDYLAKLRDKIQADFKVTVAVEREEGWQSAATLGESRLGKQSFMGDRGGSFVTTLATRIDPLVDEADRNEPGAPKPLGLYEPTGTMTDVTGNLLIARATAADPAHAPASLDEVKEKVVADVRQAEAFKLAQQAAQAAVDAAVNQGKWLQSVAADLKRPVINTGLFNAGNPQAMVIPSYEVPATARGTFASEVTDLLALPPRTGAAPRPATTRAVASAATTRPATTTVAATTGPVSLKEHPVGLIELPDLGKVLVAEVDELKPMWSKQDESDQFKQVTILLRQADANRLRAGWYGYDEATKRMNFAPTDGQARKQKQPERRTPPRPMPIGM